MSDFIDYVYKNFLFEPFIYVARYFVNERYGIFILFGIIIVLSVIQGKLKLKLTGKLIYLSKVLNFCLGILVVLLLVVSYIKYKPQITNFFKSGNQTTTPTKSPSTPSSNTKSNQTQQTVPTNQAQKQLYYSVGCSGCYKDACPLNGYSYGGYVESYYIYYKGLCQSCGCTSFRAQSLWR